MNGSPDVNANSSPWSPQPGPQTEAICADWCSEVLYGGAAGGGKSDYLLGDFLQDVPTYGVAWRGVLFRRTYNELEQLITRSQQVYPQTGAEWREKDKLWRWQNGATLRMRYLEAERDATRYQGHEYTWIGWDELTQWATAFAYRYLRARLRSALYVPTKRIRATANPGGVGHHWVKAHFIDHAPRGFVARVDRETGRDVMFIPSRLEDNKILMQADPGYVGGLRGLGSPEMVRAWLEGDWSVIQGAFFPEFSITRHVVDPFPIPRHWARFRAMDWGSARPFAVEWFAVSDGDMPKIPRGALVNYREWYGSTAKPNDGLRMTAEEVGRGIVDRERGDEIKYGVLDPAAFAEDGGPSIAERMARAGAWFGRADNARVGRAGAMGGWDQVRSRLKGDADGRPMLLIFSTSHALIRTLPALQHDEARPEDVDTDGEDHAPDALRYGCMSRPYVVDKPAEDRPQRLPAPSMAELTERFERRQRARLALDAE